MIRELRESMSRFVATARQIKGVVRKMWPRST